MHRAPRNTITNNTTLVHRPPTPVKQSTNSANCQLNQHSYSPHTVRNHRRLYRIYIRCDVLPSTINAMRRDRHRFPLVLPRDNICHGTQVPTARNRHRSRAPRPTEDKYPTNDTANRNDDTSVDTSPVADNQPHPSRCMHAHGLHTVHIGDWPSLYGLDRPIPTPLDRRQHRHACPVLL